MKSKTINAADLFCGAGGTSTGLALAAKELGLDLSLLAINHWEIAVSTHSANHPGVRHYCCSIGEVEPLEAVPGGYLRLLVASPECTHFSNARGGKPVSDQKRASAKYILRWAGKLFIQDILLENVPEFRWWGPVHRTGPRQGRPIEKRKGEFFRRFIRKLESIGYIVEYRILNAANYGDPTTRKRLFLIARRGGKKITWPEPTHNRTEEQTLFGQLQSWRTARQDVIDWSLKGQSIFGRKKPLSPNTIKRIMAGLRKFGKPFVMATGGRQMRARSADDPLPTVMPNNRLSVFEPFLVTLNSTSEDGIERSSRSIDEPVPTVTAQGEHIGLAEPFLMQLRHSTDASGHDRRVFPTERPMPTVTSQAAFGLVEPFIIQMEHGRQSPDAALKSVDKPMPTVTSGDGWGLVEPFLVEYHGGEGGERRSKSIDEPLPTLTTAKHLGLVEPFIIPVNHGKDERSHSIDEPMRTVTSVDAWALIEPYLVKYYSNGDNVQSIDEPMPTITGRDRVGIVIPELNGAVLDIRFRMLQPHELARAMSFPQDYQFSGNREEKVKQIGNAVPVMLAKALCKSLLSS